MTHTQHYWSPIKSPFGTFAAWVDGEGRLLRFFLSARGAERVDSAAQRDERRLGEVQQQVDEYAAGKRRTFDLELAAEGPEFNKLVWTALLDIPFGETTTYGALARRIGHPQSARAVGAANGANPIGLIVPCHRVIGSDGSLTGYAGGLPLKRRLLEHEAHVCGVRLDLFG